LPRAIAAAGELQSDRRHGQGSLFGGTDDATAEPTAVEGLRDLPEWTPSEKLRREKEALDFYVSSHPLAQYGDDLARFSTHSVSQLRDLPANTEVFIGGMLTQVRFMNTKKARNGNSRYARCKLEDFTGTAECVMWPDDFVRYKEFFEEDKIVFAASTVERTREEPGLVLTRLVSVEQGKRERTTGLVLLFNLREHGPQQIDAVANVLRRSRGNLPVFLHVQDAQGRWAKLKSSDEFKTNPDTLVKDELETILGPGRVQFARQANGNGRNGH
jgi:DNA polymerase III subunit alpha